MTRGLFLTRLPYTIIDKLHQQYLLRFLHIHSLFRTNAHFEPLQQLKYATKLLVVAAILTTQ
jgi:hypothetical protein